MRKTSIGSLRKTLRFCNRLQQILGVQATRDEPEIKPWRGFESFRRAAYRPQTNGNAERFIQSALREWACGIANDHSSERTAMLAKWQHHYNWHRPYAGIGGVPPISKLKPASGNNVLTLHI